MTPTDLLAKLEEAECGSWEFDLDILRIVHPDWKIIYVPVDPATLTRAYVAQVLRDGSEEVLNLPQFTRSVDAALTLVPEGWTWLVSNRARKPHTGRAYIYNGELHSVSIGGMAPNPKYRGEETTAATPALALCSAALRARALPGGGK